MDDSPDTKTFVYFPHINVPSYPTNKAMIL